ncbi:MAG: carbon monoxide dehydrogenase accessory protein CooC [Caldilineales bacterium]|nr:carbon monoxide dehydrogenase accessory protein CooC [Caldilineales bacterium]
MTKLAITGKGGVGKTTLAALLAYLYREAGCDVLAVDADPASGLANALGFPPDLAAQIAPIAEMGDLIYERTGAQPGTVGGFFKLNPRVDDIPERFSREWRGIRLLRMGAVKLGGAGCLCPENALLRALTTHLLLRRGEVLILDMEAGVEHLGRATAQAVDAMIVVVEPGRRSVGVMGEIRRLAEDIGLRRLLVVGNRVRSDGDAMFVAQAAGDLPVLGCLPFDPQLIEADLKGQAVYDAAPEVVAAARAIWSRLVAQIPMSLLTTR